MAMISRTSVTGVYAVASGWMIFLTDSIRNSVPVMRMRTEMTMLEKYSIRPKPKGCFRVAPLPEMAMATMVTREETLSAKLLTASEMTATEFATVPTMILMTPSSTLTTMPMTLVMMMSLNRP